MAVGLLVPDKSVGAADRIAALVLERAIGQRVAGILV
jgi:hypothetical protein